jgi:uncharacterized OB-fold protein
MFQTCSCCGVPRHPPVPFCGSCQSDNYEWVEAPETGRIFSYTVVYQMSHKSVIGSLPYNIVLVEFAKFKDLRLVSNVINVEPRALKIGMEVILVWEDGPARQKLPRFMVKRV